KNTKNNNLHKQCQTPINNNIQGDSVNFTGAKLGKVVRLFMSKEARANMDGFTQYAAGALNKDYEVITNLIGGKSSKRLNFFDALVEKYNGRNFGVKKDKRENPDIAIDMFKRIPFPTKHHIGFVRNTEMSVTEANTCFTILEDSSSQIKKAREIYDSLRQTGNSKRITMQLLESPNRQQYMEKFEEFKPYIETHADDENVIKQLDKHIAQNSYDKDHAKKLQIIDKAMIYIDKDAPFKREELMEGFSEEGVDVFHTLTQKMHFKSKELGEEKELLLDIYRTTTKKNAPARMAFLEAYPNCGHRDAYAENEIESISTLFKMMDENPKVSKFVKKLSETDTKLKDAEDYITLMNNVEIDVLNRDVKKLSKVGNSWNASRSIFNFYRNEPHSISGRILKSVKNIFVKTPDEKVYAENLVYVDKQPRETMFTLTAKEKQPVKKTVTQAAAPATQSNLPAIIYRFPALEPKPVQPQIKLPSMEELIAPQNKFKLPEIQVKQGAEKADTPSIQSNLPAIIYHFSALEPKPMQKAVKLPTMEELLAPQNKFKLPEINMVKEIEQPAAQEIKTADNVSKPEKTFRHLFKQRIAKQPSAKKLAVISDVNNVIEKKLGQNVYADQSRAYADKATKMRLGMLPEIFESIKETRAAERKAGTFSKSKSVKNEEALGLYRRINGKNKRLVNYMLKVKNEDGTRKYNIRDIIETLDNTNKKVMNAKSNATKEQPFRAKDEKAIYSALADEQIAQYGKLPVNRTKKS
ncbi:MAG: hypothetical protein NC200_02080, partial [Candidatus Gastranaerophilales bacterium]|nr:hypothetical protein [Candidatus Gastranaerophilales bacterium]